MISSLVAGAALVIWNSRVTFTASGSNSLAQRSAAVASSTLSPPPLARNPTVPNGVLTLLTLPVSFGLAHSVSWFS